MHQCHTFMALCAPLQADGTPQHLDADGDFLACCTHMQRLRLWRIGGREAKPYGSGSRRLDLPAGLEVRAMQVNCTGSQVGDQSGHKRQ